MAKVKWRGVVLDDRTRDMMEEVARLTGSIYVNPTHGSYSHASASAGTHSGGGAIDLMHKSWSVKDYDEVVKQMRKVGFAAWHRTPQQANWPRHVHGIAMGCKDASDGAKAQMVAYLKGRNGLAVGGPDDGPRKWAGRTWEMYQKGQMPPTEGDDMPLSDADIDKIARAVWRYKIKDYDKTMQAMVRVTWEQVTQGGLAKQVWKYVDEYAGRNMQFMLRKVFQKIVPPDQQSLSED